MNGNRFHSMKEKEKKKTLTHTHTYSGYYNAMKQYELFDAENLSIDQEDLKSIHLKCVWSIVFHQHMNMANL